jgi:hypothetical protein
VWWRVVYMSGSRLDVLGDYISCYTDGSSVDWTGLDWTGLDPVMFPCILVSDSFMVVW